jgi:hypothetical protein
MNSSNLDIPEARPGWAQSPARVVADPAWRRREKRRFRWLAWLGALALVSLAGAAAMVMLGHEPRSPGEAPLITADTTPVRVRPDDPGGMRVPNLDKAVYDQLARANAPRGVEQRGAQPGGARVESLLPPPEAPRPLPAPPPTLPAQRAALTEGPTPAQAAREPEQPAPPPQAVRATPPAQGPQAVPPTQPAANQPAAGPAAAPPPQQPQQQAAVAPAVAPAVPAGTGRIQVQLAAVPTEQAAAAEWERLRRRMPDLLGNQRLAVSRGEREGQPFFRVRTGAFADSAAARAFCEQVRTRGGSCFVAPAG